MKKNVVKKRLKLHLNRETLRTLQQAQLQDVVGGLSVVICNTYACPTMNTRCC